MKKIIIFYAILLISKFSYCQESINTSNGNLSNVYGAISYSIGQSFYSNSSNGSGQITQGIQQIYEISQLGIPVFDCEYSIQVFPIPFQNVLTLEVSKLVSEKFSYKLLNLEGKQIAENNISENKTNIEMSQLPISTYFIEVYEGNKQIQSFKIIKTN
jgi:hypothetical protein